MQGCSHAGHFPCRAFPSQGNAHAQQLVPAFCCELVRYTHLASAPETDCAVHTMFADLPAVARYLNYVHNLEMPGTGSQALLGLKLLHEGGVPPKEVALS